MRTIPNLARTLALVLLWIYVGTTAAASQDPLTPSVIPAVRSIERTEALLHLAQSPDGKVLYLADAKGGVAAWDHRDGEYLWEVKGRGTPMLAIDACEDMVVHAKLIPAFDGLDAKTGAPIDGTGAMGPGVGGSSSMACDPKGRWVWIGTQGGLIRLTVGNARGWSRRSLENGGSTCLAMDPKAKLLAVGATDGSIRFAGVKSANVDDKKVIEAHEGKVTALAFDGKGSKLVSAGEDRSIRVWKVSSGKPALELTTESGIKSLACDPKGRWIAVGEENGAVRLYAFKGGELVATLSEPDGERCVGVVFLDSGKTLAGASGKRLELWDLTDL